MEHDQLVSRLHPQVAELLEAAVASGLPPIHKCSVEEARARARGRRELLAEGPPVAELRALTITYADRQVPARYYIPEQEPDGLVVYLHGGGWMLGNIDDYDALCQTIAVSGGVSVLSVGYRLAPEHPFPAGLDDARAALSWAAQELAGGRPLVVAGDSAGANLAAVCAQLAARGEAPELALQVLVYPVTDHDLTTSSYREYATGVTLGRSEMEWFWAHYLPDVAKRDDPLAAPLRADDLTGGAPALVIVAEHDVLRDDGLAYAARLVAAGVPVTVERFTDVTHGFFTLATYLERGDEALALVGRTIRQVIQAAG
jgi:acetyl esterase